MVYMLFIPVQIPLPILSDMGNTGLNYTYSRTPIQVINDSQTPTHQFQLQC